MEEKRKQEYKMIGLNIAYYRKLKGITQLQLAEQINISRTHMSNIEAPNMPTSISLEKLFDIADALEIPISSLFNFNRYKFVSLLSAFIPVLASIRASTSLSDMCFNYILLHLVFL